MTKQIGVIAGIGDKSTDTNVIMPEFDAAFRLATLSTDCVVLDGLTLSDGILKAGHVVYKGYVCELESDTVWSGTNVFLTLGTDDNGIVNACYFSDTIESKSVVVSDSAEKIYGDDTHLQQVSFNGSIKPAHVVDASKAPIVTYCSFMPLGLGDESSNVSYDAQGNLLKWVALKIYTQAPSAKTASVIINIRYFYYADGVALISDGVANSEYYTYPYPRKCRLADKANKLVENGIIAPSVTATTQPVDDNSDKVATTKFVQNQISHDLDTTKYVASTTITATVTRGSNVPSVAEITLYRRARFVIAKVTKTLMYGEYDLAGSTVNFTLPTGYLPKENFQAYFVFRTYYTNALYGKLNKSDCVCRMTLSTNGSCTGKVDAELGTGNEAASDIAPYNAFGYECQG